MCQYVIKAEKRGKDRLTLAVWNCSVPTCAIAKEQRRPFEDSALVAPGVGKKFDDRDSCFFCAQLNFAERENQLRFFMVHASALDCMDVFVKIQ